MLLPVIYTLIGKFSMIVYALLLRFMIKWNHEYKTYSFRILPEGGDAAT